MLRIALPNKGALSAPADEMLAEAGYRTRRDRKDLTLDDPENGVEFYFLRPHDIATYVGTGTLDLGITGRDLLLDAGAEAEEVLQLGFAHSTFRYAAPRDGGIRDVADLAGKRIASTYTGLVRRDLAQRGLAAEVVHLDGAVEISVQLGVADAVADVVETGTTLRKAGLEIIGPVLLESEAVLVGRSGRDTEPAETRLVRRLEGVIHARQYVLMDYDCPLDVLEAAVEITPGFESPTVSTMQDPQWRAVRAMVRRDEIHGVMDELEDVGCRAILVTDINACRL
jgi:ATP phosphoribosyltransferase